MTVSCSITRCGNPAYCKTWCRTHYLRFREKPKDICYVNGCSQYVVSIKRGVCQAHYIANRRYNYPDIYDPIKKRSAKHLKQKRVEDLYYYEKTKQENNERRVRKRLEDKALIVKHYTQGKNKCMCDGCDEYRIEFLSVDHINGGGKQHIEELRRLNTTMYRWIIKNNFPKGFRILCMNCNTSLGHYKYCPHNSYKIPILCYDGIKI